MKVKDLPYEFGRRMGIPPEKIKKHFFGTNYLKVAHIANKEVPPEMVDEFIDWCLHLYRDGPTAEDMKLINRSEDRDRKEAKNN